MIAETIYLKLKFLINKNIMGLGDFIDKLTSGMSYGDFLKKVKPVLRKAAEELNEYFVLTRGGRLPIADNDNIHNFGADYPKKFTRTLAMDLRSDFADFADGTVSVAWAFGIYHQIERVTNDLEYGKQVSGYIWDAVDAWISPKDR